MTEQANPERGEVSIDLDGAPHVLRPSFQAQVAIEQQTGRTIEQLAGQAGQGALGLEHAAIVVTECVRAQGRAVGGAAGKALEAYNAERVGECIAEAGKLQIVKRLELLLFLAATGGYTASGEAKALPATADGAGSAATVDSQGSLPPAGA